MNASAGSSPMGNESTPAQRPRANTVRKAGLLTAFLTIIRRDLLLALRRKSDVLTVLFFFIIVVSLFPLGVGADMELLRKIAPGVLWVSALLATMLSLPRLFAADHADGTLEQLALSAAPLGVLVAGKITAHWLLSGLPLALLAPLLGLQFDLPADALGVLVLALLLGTPVLSLIGAVGAGLTLGVRGGGVLIALLVLPLYVPVLIFGAGALEAYIAGLGAGAHLSLLAACLALSAFFAPWASTLALRIALE